MNSAASAYFIAIKSTDIEPAKWRPRTVNVESAQPAHILTASDTEPPSNYLYGQGSLWVNLCTTNSATEVILRGFSERRSREEIAVRIAVISVSSVPSVVHFPPVVRHWFKQPRGLRLPCNGSFEHQGMLNHRGHRRGHRTTIQLPLRPRLPLGESPYNKRRQSSDCTDHTDKELVLIPTLRFCFIRAIGVIRGSLFWLRLRRAELQTMPFSCFEVILTTDCTVAETD